MKKLLSGLSLKSKFFLEDLFSFISTPECPGCGQPLDNNRRPICYNCESTIKRNYSGDGPKCLICHTPSGIVCDCQISRNQRIPQMYHWGIYDETMRTLIHRFKFEGQYDVGQYLSDMANLAMDDRLKAVKADLIIPIPMKRHDIKTRGFNQTEIIAKVVAETLNIPIELDVLIKIKNTKLQANLSGHDRWLNLKDAFHVTNNDKVKDKIILLVDDIVTTGATCLEAATALYEAGASEIIIFALALADARLN